jgi:hypothetical protein
LIAHLRRSLIPKSRLFLAGLLLAASAVAGGQSAPDSSTDRAGRDAIELWAGYASRSPRLGVLGKVRGMSLMLGAARFTHRVAEGSRIALDYTVDVIPVALLSPSYVFTLTHGETLDVPTAAHCSLARACRFPPDSPRGAGLSPVGLTMLFRRDHALQFRLGGTGGFLLFDRRVPTELSTHFNFTGTIEAGAQLLDRRGRGVVAVYRFHHISNAGTGFDNSALASNLFSIGGRWTSR